MLKVNVKRRSSFMKLFSNSYVRIKPQQVALVATGVSIESDAAAYIFPSDTTNISRLFIGSGVIDPDYRGEIKVILINRSRCDTISIDIGAHIASMVFVPALIQELNATSTNLLPQRATEGSVGYDLNADCSGSISVGETVEITTGVTVNFHPEIWPVVYARSGFMAKGIAAVPQPVQNGEPIVVKLTNYSSQKFNFEKDTRVAQLVLFQKSTDESDMDFDFVSKNDGGFMGSYCFGRGTGQRIKTCDFTIQHVDDLSSTIRGASGFGSTGIKKM